MSLNDVDKHSITPMAQWLQWLPNSHARIGLGSNPSESILFVQLIVVALAVLLLAWSRISSLDC